MLRYLFALCALAGLGVLIYANQRGLLHLFGIDTQQSDNYDFTSGPGPMFETGILGSGIFFTLWRHLNCHTDGCPRLARFHVAGGQFRVCGRHHREITGHPHKLTTEVISAAHRLHIGKQHEA